MSRNKKVSVKDLLRETSGGQDIFEGELGGLSFGSNMRAPWRLDSVPSLQLYWKDDKLCFKDWGGDQDCGDAVDLLMKVRGITYGQALDVIKNEYIKGAVKSTPKILAPVEIYEKDTIIDFDDQPFTGAHKKYMCEKYLLPESYLRKEDVYAVKTWALDKIVQPIVGDMVVFAYWAEDIKKTKILQLGKDAPFKWRTNVPNDYIWRFNKVQGASQVWVEKSLKDALVMNYHFGFNTTSLQNESSKIYLDHNATRIEGITKDIVINLGTDPQGKGESIKITQARGYKWFNTPNYLLPLGIEDPSDMIDEIGLAPLRELLIKKGYV